LEVPKYTPDQVNKLPEEPGVYRFYDKSEQIIYVGKAKSLKKRVSSYFNKNSGHDRKTRRMVGEIETLEFTIVNSEFDALLLENNLIKQFQPRYNILLRDDKTYPFILIPHEPFPRVIATRRKVEGNGIYFGPYASVKAMHNVLDLIRKLYTIRTCKLNLTDENIKLGKFKVCLEYHIGNCQGPCVGKQDAQAYAYDLEQAQHILKGNMAQARQYFKDQMQEAAQALQFERAQKAKNKLELLEKFQAKSLVVNPKIDNVDVFTIVTDEKLAFINYLHIKNGAIVMTKTVEVKKKLDEQDEEILALIGTELRSRYNSQAKEVISNVALPVVQEGVLYTVPKIGDKKKLVDMGIKNVLYYKKERISRISSTEPREVRIMKQLQEDLHMHKMPEHIECFDNSNLQGTNPVASMVCFKNGKPSKKDYRHYNIKTVEGPDDFASMYEVVTRRYKRLINEETPLPDLVVIDGGKGQLNAAVDALKDLSIYGQLAIVGIAKRLEELYFPEDPYPLHIDKKSESLALVQRIRDEAHRFAITFHRNQRSRKGFATQLETIEGIGKKTADKLLATFKSVKKIKEASEADLAAVIGADKARKIRELL